MYPVNKQTLKNAYIREISVTLRIVKSVAYNKCVGNYRTDISNINIGNSSVRLVEQCANLYRHSIFA